MAINMKQFYEELLTVSLFKVSYPSVHERSFQLGSDFIISL